MLIPALCFQKHHEAGQAPLRQILFLGTAFAFCHSSLFREKTDQKMHVFSYKPEKYGVPLSQGVFDLRLREERIRKWGGLLA